LEVSPINSHKLRQSSMPLSLGQLTSLDDFAISLKAGIGIFADCDRGRGEGELFDGYVDGKMVELYRNP
jgi:hypothetical protein